MRIHNLFGRTKLSCKFLPIIPASDSKRQMRELLALRGWFIRPGQKAKTSCLALSLCQC